MKLYSLLISSYPHLSNYFHLDHLQHHYLIYDVVVGEDLELTIGYSREKPFLPSTLITPTLPIVPIGDTNGVLRIVVLNPLLSQSATSSTSLNIFSKAVNCTFSVPRDLFAYMNDEGEPVNYDIVNQVFLQSALGDEDRGVKTKPVTLVQGGGRIPDGALYFGETVRSVRGLMQKFSGTNIIFGSAQVKIMMGPPSNGVNGVNWENLPWTWPTWYSNLFLGVAASERFKILNTDGKATIGISRSRVDYPLAVSTMMPMVVVEGGKIRGAEVRVPYYNPRKWVASRDIGGDANYPTTLIFQGTDVFTAVYYAFGDDIRVSVFRQVPLVSLRPEPLVRTVRTWTGMG